MVGRLHADQRRLAGAQRRGHGVGVDPPERVDPDGRHGRGGAQPVGVPLRGAQDARVLDGADHDVRERRAARRAAPQDPEDAEVVGVGPGRREADLLVARAHRGGHHGAGPVEQRTAAAGVGVEARGVGPTTFLSREEGVAGSRVEVLAGRRVEVRHARSLGLVPAVGTGRALR